MDNVSDVNVLSDFETKLEAERLRKKEIMERCYGFGSEEYADITSNRKLNSFKQVEQKTSDIVKDIFRDNMDIVLGEKSAEFQEEVEQLRTMKSMIKSVMKIPKHTCNDKGVREFWEAYMRKVMKGGEEFEAPGNEWKILFLVKELGFDQDTLEFLVQNEEYILDERNFLGVISMYTRKKEHEELVANQYIMIDVLKAILKINEQIFFNSTNATLIMKAGNKII